MENCKEINLKNGDGNDLIISSLLIGDGELCTKFEDEGDKSETNESSGTMPATTLMKSERSTSERNLNVPDDPSDQNGLCNDAYEEEVGSKSLPVLSLEKELCRVQTKEEEEDEDSRDQIIKKNVPQLEEGSSENQLPSNGSPQRLPNPEFKINGVEAQGEGNNFFTQNIVEAASISANCGILDADSSTVEEAYSSIVEEAYTPSIIETKKSDIPIKKMNEETPMMEGKGSMPKIVEKSGGKEGVSEKQKEEEEQIVVGKWKKMKNGMHNFGRPFMHKHNALPPEPNKGERLKYSCSCPPHGRIGRYLTFVLFFFLLWGSLVYVTNGMALPGGTLFSLLILVVTAQLGGNLVAKIHLPPLLGMLLVGIMFRSAPFIDEIGNAIDTQWSSSLRSMALVVILIRAGLGLDPDALRKLSFVVLRLAALPCAVEACTVAIVSYFLLEFPWKWGFLLGFVLAAVSPAVVVPCLLNLAEQGYGVEKGIPTLVIAAASIDDVIAISGFGICLGAIFSKGSTLWQGLKGPMEIGLGLGYGIIIGVILWLLPNRKEPNVNMYRFALLFLAGLLAIFGSKGIDFGGAGALGCLCVAFVAGYGWKKQGRVENKTQVPEYFNFLWMLLQPLLFGLIGTEIRVADLHPSTIGYGVVTLIIGLTLRVSVSFFAVMGGNLTLKERFFVALAWLPKATVQAAIGSTALDFARGLQAAGQDMSEEILLGTKVLTIAVLVILITAPIGAAAIMLSAPKLLKKKSKTEKESEFES